MEKNKIVSSIILSITESLMHATDTVASIPAKIRITASVILFIILLFVMGKMIFLLIFLAVCAFVLYLYLRAKAIKEYLTTLAPAINGRVLGSCIKEGCLQGLWQNSMVKVIYKKDINVSFYSSFSTSLSFACRGWWNAKPTKQWKIVNIEDNKFTKDFFVLEYEEGQAKKFLTKKREAAIANLLTKSVRDKLSKFSRTLFIYPEYASFSLAEARPSLKEFSEVLRHLSELAE